MKKILFTHSYFLRFDPKQWELGQPYPPLGTLYAAALMEKQGYSTFFHDVMFEEHAEAVLPYLDEYKPDYFVIYDDGFNYLTKMCLTNMREAAYEMAKLANERGIKVVISSSDSTDHYDRYLNEGVDFVLLGEAEETLKELILSIDSGSFQPQAIKGIAFRNDTGEVIKNERRGVIRNLDELPLPAWDLLNIAPYHRMWRQKNGYFSLNMGTTRGCPYKCNWCAKPIYGNRYNSRSPKLVVEELVMLKEKFNYDHIWFCDDIFGLKPGWVHEFADLVEQSKLKLKYKIQSRADLLLQENYVQDLARSGCETVWMGAESGSQKILDAMDKGTTVAQIYEANRLLQKHGIKTAFFLQFGYLNETMDDIQLTLKMLDDCLPDDIGISVSYPLPGTKFYETVKNDLTNKANWSDSDDLDLMFKNTYSPQFYKQLHRYVHKRYRQKQGWQSLKKLLSLSFIGLPLHLRRAVLLAYYIPATISQKYKLNKSLHVTGI